MKQLNPNHYRSSEPITRDNVDALIDAGSIEVAMRNGNWWHIRRNGATKRWKRDPNRIRIPFKMGLYGYGAIEEICTLGNGS
jgi:hypothetical protein